MYNGFLLRDDSKKPYKYYIKTSTDAFTVSVATFREVFSSFGETELENYLESNFLHARRRELSKTAIDPITGETVELANLNFDKLIASPSRACAKMQTKHKTPSLSIDEMLEPSVSATEDEKPKPKLTRLSAYVIFRLLSCSCSLLFSYLPSHRKHARTRARLFGHLLNLKRQKTF